MPRKREFLSKDLMFGMNVPNVVLRV